MLVLVADHATKTLVLARVGAERFRSGRARPWIRHVPNTSLGFGLIHSRSALLWLWGAAVLGIILLIHYVPPFRGQAAQVGLGAALAAPRNLLDRLRRGSVVDFIDLRIWPVFNVADAAIVSGVVVVLWVVR